MLPTYFSVFSVNKEGLKDDHFLSRLRSGPDDCRSREGNRTDYQSMKRGKEKRKDKKDNQV